MYIPEIYRNEDKGDIVGFITRNNFALLINQTMGRLWATHIPIEYEADAEGKEVLYGHLSAHNPQASSFADNGEVLVVFSGADHYISPSWYNHENVPTWNYEAVHVYGRIKLIEDAEGILGILKKQTDRYEQIAKCPIKIEGLSAETLEESKGTKGFVIEISEMEAVKKMSQNRDEENYRNIVEELRKTGENRAIAIAEEMEKLKK